MPHHPTQTEFREQVYKIVSRIPAGRVMTYGDIALLIPAPNGMHWERYRKVSPRWVGYAMAASPTGLPWHRVINSKGEISPRSDSDWHVQMHLLKMEGVEFNAKNQIDLSKYRWSPEIPKQIDPQSVS
jgi:methylated-DNA-protein-cysteine methyltransferase-like protein